MKGRVVEQLEKGAEMQYQALVRQEALRIMERHPSLKAEEAVAAIDSTMLELAIAPRA